jgi:hypothetical protein
VGGVPQTGKTRTVFCRSEAFVRLEEILQRELHDARIKRRDHLTECGVVEIRRWNVLPEAVREIERLRAELHSLRFLESEISRERDVELPPSGTKNRSPA